jgi:hypothetical protein
MAGSVRVLIPLAIAALAGAAFGQTPPSASPAPAPKKQPGAWLGAGRKPPFDGTPSPEFENVRRALEALTPEQRKRFQENVVRWANLSPEEKKALRDREEVRKNFMQQEIETVIKESGLQLDGERREQFIKRYGDERRKIEEQLRKEINEKRKPLVHELIGRLKAEFAEPSATPVASPTPAAR